MFKEREEQVLRAAVAAGIQSPRELANFMAQVTSESNNLTRLEESFLYTKGINQIPVSSAWRQGGTALEAARQEALRGNPQQLAELMYGGRMGNNSPGDGYKYRGRGYIQLTGKNNYRTAGNAVGLDLVEQPELAVNPETATKIAIWYWQTNVPKAAREDVKAATQAINNGYNGLEDRKERFAQWEKALTPSVMAGLYQNPINSPVILRQGAHGPAVAALQSQLARLGYLDGLGRPLLPDGDFGPATRDTLMAFQHDYGLTADGVAGPDIQAKLHELSK